MLKVNPLQPQGDSDSTRAPLQAGAGSCDLCGQHAAVTTLRVGVRSLVRCRDCDLVRQDPMPTAKELSEVYDTGEYYTHEAPRLHASQADSIRNAVLDAFWGYPREGRPRAGLFRKLLLRPLRDRAMPVPYPGDAPVLDIGCGNGQRLLELQSRGCTQLFGVEPTEGAAEQARKSTCADVRTCLLEEAGLPDDHFQLIVMNQVLEHVPSPSATLRRVYKMLRPGGYLYLTVPNYGAWEAGAFGHHWSGLQIPAHLHHFTPAPLRRLVDEAGLQVTTWRTDTTVAITRASLYGWYRAKPSPLRRRISHLPRLTYAPLTVVADLMGKGQMLRVVARRPEHLR